MALWRPSHTRLSRWLGGGRSNDPLEEAGRLYRAGRFADADQAAQRLLQKSPGQPDALHLRARVALRGSQFASAARYMEEAVNAAPARIDLLHDLGETLALAGRQAAALQAYDRAVAAARAASSVAPPAASAASAHSSGSMAARDQALAANALLRLGRTGEAAAQIRAALQADPNEAEALAVSARLAARGGDGATAIARLQSAVRGRPGDTALMAELAHMLVGHGEMAAAAPLLRQVLAIAPAEREAQYALTGLLAARVRAEKDSPPPDSPRGAEGTPGNTHPASASAGAGAGAIGSPSPQPFISVIICSVNAAKFSAVTANYERLLADHPHEIIGIHNAASLCEGYNRGAQMSRGDILVFSHDDIEILTPDFGPRLARHMARHDVVGACGTSLLVTGHWISAGWPHVHGLVAHQFPAGHAEAGRYRVMVLDPSGEDCTAGLRALDGLFIAVKRAVLERCRFDAATFDGFHLYDLDFTFAAFHAGFDVAVFRDITLVHRTAGDSPGYEAAFARYRTRFEEKYAADLAPRDAAPLQFIPALFDTADEVRRFCAELLAFRKSVAGGGAG